jgi:hypothetical protein
MICDNTLWDGLCAWGSCDSSWHKFCVTVVVGDAHDSRNNERLENIYLLIRIKMSQTCKRWTSHAKSEFYFRKNGCAVGTQFM